MRDNRTYQEVIEEAIKENREKEDEIAFSSTVRLEENKEMIKYLKRVVIAETSEVISNEVVYKKVLKVWSSIVRMFHLVPSKYLIVLKSIRRWRR